MIRRAYASGWPSRSRRQRSATLVRASWTRSSARWWSPVSSTAVRSSATLALLRPGGECLASLVDRSALPRHPIQRHGRREGWRVSAPPLPADLFVHLRRARDHADRHYAEPLDLDELAAVAGCRSTTSCGCSGRPTASRRGVPLRGGASSGPRTCCARPTSRSPRCATRSASPASARSAAGSASWSARRRRLPAPVAEGRAPHPRLLRLHVGPRRASARSAIAEKQDGGRRRIVAA